jgi:hypothetical protein
MACVAKVIPAVNALVKRWGIADCLNACPPTGEGMNYVKERIVQTISWKNARTMIQSDAVQKLTELVVGLLGQNVPVASFGEIKSRYEKVTGTPISSGHMKFLLSNFSDQGIIEYYPSVLDAVIFNDKEYNRLKSEIPFYVSDRNGIVSIDELRRKFKPVQYVEILDRLYLGVGVAIQNRDLRIFPANLRDGEISIPHDFKDMLKEAEKQTREFRPQRPSSAPLIAALSELNMGCVDASKSEGFFSWEKNAYVYYTFNLTGDVVTGRHLQIAYYTGGKRDEIVKRLRKEFDEIIEHLYGPR